MKNIAVIYLLAYAIPNYELKAKKFKDTYKNFDSGYKHDLFIIHKGADKNVYEGFKNIPHFERFHTNIGWDIGSYKQFVKSSNYDYYLFIGTHTYPNGNNWLLYFINAAEKLELYNNLGIAGPVGSYEQGINPNKRNPHIRTNCFFISKEKFNQLIIPEINTKQDTYELEHGCDSITNQLKNKGCNNIVIGKDGNIFYEDKWCQMNGFRQNNQENLLFCDRLSEEYDLSNGDKRIMLQKLIWGNN